MTVLNWSLVITPERGIRYQANPDGLKMDVLQVGNGRWHFTIGNNPVDPVASDYDTDGSETPDEAIAKCASLYDELFSIALEKPTQERRA